MARERLVDTLMLARRKHPGGSNRLDDLCPRYRIDNSKRIKHGALLDAELLAEVYIELIGARQAKLGLAASDIAAGQTRGTAIVIRDAAAAAARRASRRTSRRRTAPSSPRSAKPRSGGNIWRAELQAVAGGAACTCAMRC